MQKVIAAFGGLVIFLISGPVSVSAADRSSGKTHSRSQALNHTYDVTIDANMLEMFVYNDGNFAYDNRNVNGKTDGLYYPRGLDMTVIYSAGIWVGAKVGGDIHCAIAEYSSEFVPCGMENGTFIPDNETCKVYKIKRGDGSENPDYANWPADQGAPIDEYGNPALLGDMMTWSVFNDANPATHENECGSTDPLGIEVQHCTFAYSRLGALGNVIFMKFKIINNGYNELDSTFVAIWADPDLGDAGDDLVGCDTFLSLGYCYNSGTDNTYGSKPPAVGFDFFQGPIVPGDVTDTAYVSGVPRPDFRNLPMTAFARYINGEDPRNATQSYLFMTGLQKNLYTGEMVPAVDPETGDTTTFVHAGDPVTGEGWIDSAPADRRFMLTSGPFTMMPGDTQEVVTAVLVGQGTDPLNSITALKEIDVQTQAVFDLNFDIPVAPPSPSVNLRGHNGIIEIFWGSEPVGDVEVNETLGQEFHFEGFNLYQGESATGPWHKFATYDEVNDVAFIYGDVYDPEVGGIQRIILQHGSNSGLDFCHLLTYSQLDETPIANGEAYYFAVTAYSYDYNNITEFQDQYGNLLGHLTETLESQLVGFEIMPLANGVVSDTAEHVAGESDGIVIIEYLIPEEITGHAYEVTFNGDYTWNLQDMITGEFVLQNVEGQAPGCNFPIVDGVMVRTQGPTLGVKAVLEIANGDGPVIPPDNVHYSLNSTRDWYINPGGDHSYSRYSWQGATMHNYEIRFTENATEYCFDWFGQGDYARVNSFQVPIEFWDIGINTPDDPSDDRRICFMIIDDDLSGNYNFGDGLYIWDIDYYDVSWLDPNEHTGNHDPDYDGLHYGRWWFEDYSGNFNRPAPGTIVRTLTNKINTPEDVFVFMTSYVCGDCDGSGEISVSDVVYLVDYIFNGGPAPHDINSGDLDCDGMVIIGDAVYLVNYVFIPGAPPPCDPDGDGEPDC